MFKFLLRRCCILVVTLTSLCCASMVEKRIVTQKSILPQEYFALVACHVDGPTKNIMRQVNKLLRDTCTLDNSFFLMALDPKKLLRIDQEKIWVHALRADKKAVADRFEPLLGEIIGFGTNFFSQLNMVSYHKLFTVFPQRVLNFLCANDFLLLPIAKKVILLKFDKGDNCKKLDEFWHLIFFESCSNDSICGEACAKFFSTLFATIRSLQVGILLNDHDLVCCILMSQNLNIKTKSEKVLGYFASQFLLAECIRRNNQQSFKDFLQYDPFAILEIKSIDVCNKKYKSIRQELSTIKDVSVHRRELFLTLYDNIFK